MAKTPWMKFYPSDWQSDILLRSCSIAARGLWIELLCIMQKAEPKGYLLINGQPPEIKLLSILCGVSEKEIRNLITELESTGVCSRTDYGVIYSRRMIRDEEKASRDKANGKRGGNPQLKSGVNPPDNPNGGVRVKGEDKAHIPEARSQKKNTDQEGSYSEVEGSGYACDVVQLARGGAA